MGEECALSPEESVYVRRLTANVLQWSRIVMHMIYRDSPTKYWSSTVLIWLCAAIVSVSIKMPLWTGVASSRTWPIGVCVVLTIAWIARNRFHRVDTDLAASLLGIAIGLALGKVARVIETGRLPSMPSLLFAVVSVTALLILYKRAQAKTAALEVSLEGLHSEVEGLENLAPEDREVRLRQMLDVLQANATEIEHQLEERQRRQWITDLLVAAGLGLTIATMTFVDEGGGVVLTATNWVIIACGLAYYVYRLIDCWSRRRMRESR